LPVGGEPVGFVGPHGALGRNHAFARHDGAQVGNDLLAAGEHGLIGGRHDDGHGDPTKLPPIQSACRALNCRQG
jgi:hypothetical protein